jgi:hypothetical protein
LTISSSTFPTEWYALVLANNSDFNRVINRFFNKIGKPFINYTDDYQGLKNAIARVNVYYDDLRYTKIDDSPAITSDTLFGILGGNLGLLLGLLMHR